MFEEMYERLLSDVIAGDERSPVYLHHAKKLAARSRSIDAREYMANTEPNQIVVDYLASMTDRYFMALYRSCSPKASSTSSPKATAPTSSQNLANNVSLCQVFGTKGQSLCTGFATET